VPQKPALKASTAHNIPKQSDTSATPGTSLLDGQFNEGESHNSFLEALNAFRGKPTEKADDEKKSVRFQGEAAAKKPSAGKNNFFANIDGKESNWTVVEGVTTADGGIQADETMSKTSNVGPKESCWQCYGLFPAGEGFHCDITGKDFKTKLCL